MDELFFLPPVPVAIPRAYWLDSDSGAVDISSLMIVLQPSDFEFARINKLTAKAKPGDYDMEILNTLYKDQALLLPHRQYAVLTSVFRWTNHSSFLGSEEEPWDPDVAIKDAKYIHFSDWPVPKV